MKKVCLRITLKKNNWYYNMKYKKYLKLNIKLSFIIFTSMEYANSIFYSVFK